MAGAKRTLGLLAIGFAALLLAGCGSSKKSSSQETTTTTAAAPLAKAAYVTQMKAIGQSLSNSLNGLSSATTAAKAAIALTKVQVDLRAAADRIDAITPPDAVKAQHDQLVKAVNDFADELDPVIASLKKGSLAALSTVPTLKGLTEIQAASTAIASKGYKIGGN